MCMIYQVRNLVISDTDKTESRVNVITSYTVKSTGTQLVYLSYVYEYFHYNKKSAGEKSSHYILLVLFNIKFRMVISS